MAMVTVYWVPELPWTATPNVPAEGVYCTLLTHNEVGVIAEFPVLLKVIKMLPWVASPLANVRFVIWPCSVAMKLKVRAPIHAATAMLTATVTAISMIEATTGLRAFLLLNIFIFLFIPPFGVTYVPSRSLGFKSYDSLHKISYLYNKNTRQQQITVTAMCKLC